MRGPVSPTFDYVLKCEREALTEEKTVWSLKVLTAADSSASLRKYSKAFINSGNKQELDEVRYKQAFRSEFLDVVKQVTNYQFGFKFPDLQEQGYLTTDEPDVIVKIFEELPEAYVRELIETAKGDSALEELDSKKLQSVSSSPVGKHKS